MGYKIGTKCIHLEGENALKDQYGSISSPIYQTATFAHYGVGKSTGYDYSRLQNPTREQLEKIVCSLEKGDDAMAFASGMAAIATLMEIFTPGDHLIIENDLYGGSVRLFDNMSKKNGITFTGADFCRDDIESLIQDNTKALYIETPTNPMMNVTDIAKMSEIAKKHNLMLIVDNTFLSPYYQNPLELGADILIHSGTKYLGGHNDVIAGFLVTGSSELSEKIRFLFKTSGACLGPMDSWLVLRGIKTLGLRMDKASDNALKLAKWLQLQEKVTKVYYPGLTDHPGYEVMKKQSRGFGGMVTFELESKELALYILENVKLIHFAESLGGTESLLTYPITQTHADVPKELLDKNGVTDRVLRLSVGIEDVEDLIEELERIFKEA